MATTRVSTPHSYCCTIDSFLLEESADQLFHELLKVPVVKDPKGQLFGKTITMHRSITFFSDEVDYFPYAGQRMRAQRMPVYLQELLAKVNELLDCKFNGILMNVYIGGQDYIGPHSDSNHNAYNGTIAGLSLGTGRIFRIKNKKTRETLDILTTKGQLLIMGGNFQDEFTHEVPIARGVEGTRISLTFRKHN